MLADVRKRLNKKLQQVDNNGPPQIYYLTADDLSGKYYNKPAAIVHNTPKPLIYSKPAPLIYHRPVSQPYAYNAPYAAAYPISYYPPPQHKSNLFVPSAPIQADESSEESGDCHDCVDRSSSSSSESDESGSDESKANYSHGSHESSEDGGKENEEKYHKKSGKKASKGYSHEIKYEKGRKGSHDVEHGSKDDSEEGGNKKSHYDEADKHSEHESEASNKKGGEYGHKKNHKKGSKSKGYHNVFMKDEYKKDHTFYGRRGRAAAFRDFLFMKYFQIPPITKATTRSTARNTKSTMKTRAAIKRGRITMRPWLSITTRRREALTKAATTRAMKGIRKSLGMPKSTRTMRNTKRMVQKTTTANIPFNIDFRFALVAVSDKKKCTNRNYFNCQKRNCFISVKLFVLLKKLYKTRAFTNKIRNAFYIYRYLIESFHYF